MSSPRTSYTITGRRYIVTVRYGANTLRREFRGATSQERALRFAEEYAAEGWPVVVRYL